LLEDHCRNCIKLVMDRELSLQALFWVRGYLLPGGAENSEHRMQRLHDLPSASPLTQGNELLGRV
jgi:hypothetical protein